MNYWFLYDATTGTLMGAPYFGTATEWLNIPEGQAVLGPFDQVSATADVTEAYLNPSYYTVQNGVLVKRSDYADLQLSDAKQAKLTQLHQSLEATIAEFQSSALGSAHSYLADPTSMMLLGSTYSFVRSSDVETNYTVKWYTKEAGRVNHTAVQIAQVYLDGHLFIQSQYDHFADVESQVIQAATLDQVKAVTW